MDDFSVPDGCIGAEVGSISDNKLINAAMEGFISLKDARRNLVGKIEKRVQNFDKVMNRLDKRRQRINRMMETAPFRRKQDKFSYVLGTTIVLTYSYTIGKFPHSHIYTLTTLILTLLLCHRYF